jgi:hypothetical protein
VTRDIATKHLEISKECHFVQKKQIKGRECSNKGEQIDRGMKMDDLDATHSELIRRRRRRKLSLHPLICFVMLFGRYSVYGFLIGGNHEVGWGDP